MDREEMIRRVEKASAEYASLLRSMGAHEPDWAPLEKAVPLKWCGAFMFMGYDGHIRIYKHGFTRRYLHLDPKGDAYRYDGGTPKYVPIPRSDALKHVFTGLKRMGISRTTPYDEKARKRKEKALAKAGYTLITIHAGNGEVTRSG